nr:hypothetical protein [Tanacetum cinerariifolium]
MLGLGFDGYGIEGFWLGFGALTGAKTGSMMGATTVSKFRVGVQLGQPEVGLPLRVVIPFKSSFGLVIVLLRRVSEPEDEASQLAVEESGVDELELGNPGLDKLVLDKLVLDKLEAIKPSGGMMCQGVRKEIQMKGVIGTGGSPFPSAAISKSFKIVGSARDLLRIVSSGLSRAGKRFLADERVLMHQK